MTFHYFLGHDYIHSMPLWFVFTFAQQVTDMVSKRNCFNLVIRVLGDSQCIQFITQTHTHTSFFWCFISHLGQTDIMHTDIKDKQVAFFHMFASFPNI